jgi:hypothetical protein
LYKTIPINPYPAKKGTPCPANTASHLTL